MALAGYINQDTYTSIDEVNYSDQDKSLDFRCITYENDTREEILAVKPISLLLNQEIREIVSTTESTPPEDRVEGDSYLIPKDGGNGDWSGFSGRVAQWVITGTDGGAWVFMGYSPGQIFYNTATNSYIEITNKDGSFKAVYTPNDTRIWDLYFSKDKVYAQGANLHKQIYIFLKTLPDFQNTTDI